MSRWFSVTLVVGTAVCGADPVAAQPAVDDSAEAAELAKVEVALKAAPPPDQATFDFRLVHLDDETVGTSQRCDVGHVHVSTDDTTQPIMVSCLGGAQGSTITFARTDERVAAVAKLERRTQIEVRIDGPGVDAVDGDAKVTFERVVGMLAPPPPPSRCSCRDDRELEASRPTPPEGWDFAAYEKNQNKHWGETHTCHVGQVGKIERTSAAAKEYSIGRVFDAETLPFVAEIYCRSGAGSQRVLVGAHSAQQLLRLERDQRIELELGWVTRYYHAPTGKLLHTSYDPPSHRYDD